MNQDSRTSTDAEAELEGILNSLGKGALRGEFKREWRVGDWAVDFYFPDIRLAIEVDGGYHRALSRWRKDGHKTRDLAARGITVLRLANAEVFGDRERLVIRLRAAWRSAQTRMASNHHRAREADVLPYLHAPSTPATRTRRCRYRNAMPVRQMLCSRFAPLFEVLNHSEPQRKNGGLRSP